MSPERLRGFLDAANVLALHGMRTAANLVLDEAQRRQEFGCICTIALDERMAHPECPVHAAKTERAPAPEET